MKTTAILDEATGEYVLNGTKCFISGGGQADYLLIFALTDPLKGVKGLSCILLEKGTPGFSIGKIENKMGIHGSETAELIFDNCRIPKENLIGQEGKGALRMMSASYVFASISTMAAFFAAEFCTVIVSFLLWKYQK